MKRACKSFITLGLLLWTAIASAANGDLSGWTVLSNGWQATVQAEGLSTGGTYDFGLGSNNDPTTGTPKVVFTVVSMGYDATGTPTTVTRTVYGTLQIRQPYPTADLADESGSSPVTLKIALSDYIYDSDNSSGGTGGNSGTAVTVTTLSGFYTQGGTPTAAVTNASVTNNSTETYPRVVGNWTEPGYAKLGATQRLRMTCAHGYARSGKQVACVKFTSTDSSSHSATSTVTSMSIDSSYGDAVPVCEYIADLDTSGFTQNDVVASNFIAYPWIGNGYSVLDTAGVTTNSTPGTAQPTHLYGPIKFVADPAGTYSPYVAVVDPSTGDDGTGTVGTDYATVMPYLTMAGAFNAIRAQNNTSYSRNNCGGSTIYLKTGNHTWTGGTVTVGTDPDVMLTVRAYPGLTRADVIVTAQSGTKYLGKLCKIQRLRWTFNTAASIDPAVNSCVYWADDVEINQPNASSWYARLGTNGVFHFTRGYTPTYKQGFRKVGGATGIPAIVRGNDLNTALSYPITGVNMIIGNTKSNNQTWSGIADYDSTITSATNTFIGYNRLSGPGTNIKVYQSSGDLHGSAIIQNVLESTAITSPSVQFCADGASAYNVKNLIVQYNTFAGPRNNICYNENGAAGGAGARRCWFFLNNLYQGTRANKTDTFAGNSATATRTGSGPVTVTVTQSGHNYVDGDTVYATATPAGYSTTPSGATVTYISSSQFSYEVPTTDLGVITAMTVGPHPLRIGNWADNYAVGASGNYHAEETASGSGSFMQNFVGIRCYLPGTPNQNATGPASVSSNVVGWCEFTDAKSYQGSNGAAGGDYTLTEDSPVLSLQPIAVGLPFDFAGTARTSADPPGAYTVAVDPPDPGAAQTILQGIVSDILIMFGVQ